MKIIVLAQPKTASTSLMYALGDLMCVDFRQEFWVAKTRRCSGFYVLLRKVVGFFNRIMRSLSCDTRVYVTRGDARMRDAYPAFEWPALAMFHSDIVDLKYMNSSLESIFTSDLHKQHLPPTASNIKAFRNIPKVILVREPSKTIESYRRVKNLGNHLKELLRSNEFCEQLERELSKWQKDWIDAVQGQNNSIVVTMDDVLNNPVDVLRRISRISGADSFSVPDEYVLPRKRYAK